jgi:hypothetical protein
VPLSTADKLAQDAAEAARVRALANHPDVIALRVEKVRGQVDSMIWVEIYLGLAFTMVNVQTFAAAGAAVWSLAWLAAWLLDPMVSLVLVAVLRAEQITARYQVREGMQWAHRAKWFALAATYTMNTWQSWAAGHVAGIVLHSVPPCVVFLAAETAPWLRDRLTEAVHRAATPTAPDRASVGTERGNAAGLVNTPPAAPENAAVRPQKPVHDTTRETGARPVRRAPRTNPPRRNRHASCPPTTWGRPGRPGARDRDHPGLGAIGLPGCGPGDQQERGRRPAGRDHPSARLDRHPRRPDQPNRQACRRAE